MGVVGVGDGLRKISGTEWVDNHPRKAKRINNRNVRIAMNLREKIQRLEEQLAYRSGIDAGRTSSPSESGCRCGAQGASNAVNLILSNPFAGMQASPLFGLQNLMSQWMDPSALLPVSSAMGSSLAFSAAPWAQNNLRDLIAFAQAQHYAASGFGAF